ncbi:MAG: hypothetical protein AB1599_03150 [Planctomycetota bacterium]
MNQTNVSFWLFILIIFGIVGCYQPPNLISRQIKEKVIHTEDIGRLRPEEKKEVIYWLEEYLRHLKEQTPDLYPPDDEEFERRKKEYEGFKSKDNREIIVGFKTVFLMDELLDQQLLKEIRQKFKPVAQDINQQVYLIDIEAVKSLYNKFASWDSGGSAPTSSKNPIASFFPVYAQPNYFYYIDKDGKERRLALLRHPTQLYKMTSVIITPEIEADDNAIAVDYYIRRIYPREGMKHLIKGEKVSIVDEKSILGFLYRGKYFIPKGKCLVIECLPYGDNLTETEKRKNFLVFITCETNNNSDTSGQSSSQNNK